MLSSGIDLGGSPWPCVTLNVGSRGEVVHEHNPKRIPGPILLDAAGPLLMASLTQDPSERVSSEWRDLKLKLEEVRELVPDQLPKGSLIGVAYPRSMPPILRQYLPRLFGTTPASVQGGLPPDSPLIGLEAPAALILQAIALERIKESGTYAVATGQGAALEWTTIILEISSSNPLSQNSPTLRIQMGQTAAALESLGLDSRVPRLVADAGPALGERAKTDIHLDSSAVAEGAARFAAWLSLKLARPPVPQGRILQRSLIPGTPIISSKTTNPLGLIGNDGQGSWFWRRLFEPGTAIPTHQVTIQSDTRPPCYLYVAECLSPDHRRRLWIPQEEWIKARLQWHSYWNHTETRSPEPPLRWSLELLEFNREPRGAPTSQEPIPPRWGIPQWLIRIEQATTDPAASPPLSDR